jgi:hypothetical protein
MAHLKIVNLLTAMANAKQILSDLGEIEDYKIVQLLENKYENIYRQYFTSQKNGI